MFEPYNPMFWKTDSNLIIPVILVIIFGTKLMNVHYIDVHNYIRAEYARIKTTFLGKLISVYKEWNALLTATAIIRRTFCWKIPTVEIPQFPYSSTLCLYQNTLRFSHTNISVFYPVSRRRLQWLPVLILAFVLEWPFDHTDPIWSACSWRHVQSNCRPKRTHASAGRDISGKHGALWQRAYSRESCTC